MGGGVGRDGGGMGGGGGWRGDGGDLQLDFNQYQLPLTKLAEGVWMAFGGLNSDVVGINY